MSETSGAAPSPSRPGLLGRILGVREALRRAFARLGVFGIALYYLAILIALILLHGRGSSGTQKFIYQGF
jgi:hypothetical protein